MKKEKDTRTEKTHKINVQKNSQRISINAPRFRESFLFKISCTNENNYYHQIIVARHCCSS